jgi:hypothetical protein
MSHFWHQQPITNLGQRYHSECFPYGLYPNAALHSVTAVSPKNVIEATKDKYNLIKLDEMVAWCEQNVRGHFSWSARCGSFGFSKKEDAALFRMFFDDDTMPPPEIDKPIYPWQYREREAELAKIAAEQS